MPTCVPSWRRWRIAASPHVWPFPGGNTRCIAGTMPHSAYDKCRRFSRGVWKLWNALAPREIAFFHTIWFETGLRLTYYVSSFSSGGGRCPNPTRRASRTRYHCFWRAFIGRLKGFSLAALLPRSLSILTSFPFYAGPHSARYQIQICPLAHRRAFAVELNPVGWGTRCSWNRDWEWYWYWKWSLFGCWQGVYRTNKLTIAEGKSGWPDIGNCCTGQSLHCTERIRIYSYGNITYLRMLGITC